MHSSAQAPMATRGMKAFARAAGAVALVVVLSTLSAVGLSSLDARPAAAATEGCGYADASPGNGDFASTICWFDFSAFDMAQARSDAGQAMQITLEGGYVANFTVRFSDVAGTAPMSVELRATPLESRFAFGTDAYRGIPGSHTLYSHNSPGGVKGGELSFEDIEIVDSLGGVVTGYSFVAADTEDNVSGESFAWSSDQPLTEIERLAENGSWGCKSPAGLGTTEVTCAGTGAGGTTTAGGKSTSLLVAADSPTRFSTRWITHARSGIAIGIQTAKITLVKQVSSRVAPADSFTVAVAGPTGTVVGSATTGSANTATTGVVNTLAGGTFTLSDAPAVGSPANLANYTAAWSCTNANPSSTTVLPTGTGATKTVTPLAGDDITCTVSNTAGLSALTLVKSAGTPTDVNGNGITDVGDTIPYSFTVTNSGTTTLEEIAVSDPRLGEASCPAGPLGPGASVVCSAVTPATVTAADSAAGAVVNVATASGSPLGSTTVVTSAPSTTSTPVAVPAPALTIVKSASPSHADAYTAGQLITFSFVVTNSGNVTIENVTVDEAAFSGTGDMSAISCPAESETMLAGAQIVCTATYTLTQLDVNAGTLTNSATATGDPIAYPEPVTSDPSSFAVPVDAAPAVGLVKSVTPTTAGMPGSTVTYSFAITNTGNVSLSSPQATETAFSGTGAAPVPVCPDVVLLPGATATCTATYTLTQADVDAGTVTNTATASALAPGGEVPVSEPADAVVTIPAAPLLTLTKSATTAGPGIAGDVVSYGFLVTNLGNVTVSDLRIDETLFTGSGDLGAVTCPADPLASGDSTTCTASYTLTQADVDAGEVANTAVAVGDPAGPGAETESNTSSATVTTTRTAAISLLKSVTPAIAKAGVVATYSFAVTNTGTVTLSAVSITEVDFGGSGPVPAAECPATPVLPGASVTCTADYLITAADAGAGSVVNTATATAEAPAGVEDPVSAASTATLAVEPPTGPLAVTGSAPAWANTVLVALALGAGGVLLTLRRRRTAR